jgi:putative DNA primase/helicase
VTATIISKTAGEVVPRPVRFLAEPTIPLGEPTILAGAPGLGKTQLAIGIAARATTGRLAGALEGKPVHVAYVTAEDSLEYTLVPRFIAAGGEPSRIHFFEAMRHDDGTDASLQVPKDIPQLDAWVQESAAKVLVLDPLVAFIPASLSSHKDQHVRQALAPLARMCHDRDLAALLILHLNKDREAGALNRLSGSIGFGAAARSVLLFAHDPDDPEGENGSRRVLAHLKSNLARKAPSVAYVIERRIIDGASGAMETSAAIQQGETRLSASDLLGHADSSTEASARGEARTFLLSELSEGPVTVMALRESAEHAGIAWRTLERVKKAEGIRSRKLGSEWAWEVNSANPPITTHGGLDGRGGLDGGNTANTANTARGGNGEILDEDRDRAEAIIARHAGESW